MFYETLRTYWMWSKRAKTERAYMIIHVGAAYLLAESLPLPLSLILPRIFSFAAERMV